MNPQNTKTIMDIVNGGKMPMVGLYLGFKASARDYTSPVTGKKGTMKIAEHVIVRGDETHSEALTVGEMLDDNADPAAYKAPVQYGQRVCVIIEQIKQEKGAWKVRCAKGGLIQLVPELATEEGS